jgi:hypothetical protein
MLSDAAFFNRFISEIGVGDWVGDPYRMVTDNLRSLIIFAMVYIWILSSIFLASPFFTSKIIWTNSTCFFACEVKQYGRENTAKQVNQLKARRTLSFTYLISFPAVFDQYLRIVDHFLSFFSHFSG